MNYKEKIIALLNSQELSKEQKEKLEGIFPELKESEGERIRKDIIVLIKDWWDRVNKDNISTKEQMLAWLEKQGKKEKFIKKELGCIRDYRDEAIKRLNKLEKQGEQKPAFETKTPEESLGIDSDTYNKIVDECVYGEQISANETPYPETLEEAIDLYYNSYGNGEGEFEHLSLEKFRDIVHTFVGDYGQKTAWSEEEEKLVKNLISTLSNLYARNLIEKETKEKYTNLLKSLKDRYTWKPSDEQMKAIKWIIDGDNPENWSITIENLYQDLKKLREK